MTVLTKVSLSGFLNHPSGLKIFKTIFAILKTDQLETSLMLEAFIEL